MGYVDYTLLLAKEDDIKYIFDNFSLFHKNLKFIDRFEGNKMYFLDIPIDKTGTDLYYKLAHTGQYCDFNCSLLWIYKTLWINSFCYCERKIGSSTEKFKSEIDKIKLFLPWNGYSLHTCNSFISLLRSDTKSKGNGDKNDQKSYMGLHLTKTTKKNICVTLPYPGYKRDKLKKSCFKKVWKYLTENIYFFNAYHVLLRQRHSYHTPKPQCLTCPAGNENYIGKADHNLATGLHEHGSGNYKPMH